MKQRIGYPAWLVLSVCVMVWHSSSGQSEEVRVYQVIKSYLNELKSSDDVDTNLALYKTDYYDIGAVLNSRSLKRNTSFRTINIDSLFSQGDYDFMANQLNLNEKVKNLDRTRLRDFEIESTDKLQINNSQVGKSKIRVALPLFSKDKKKALLYVEERCNPNCSNGTLYMFSYLENSRWRLLGNLSIWVE